MKKLLPFVLSLLSIYTFNSCKNNSILGTSVNDKASIIKDSFNMFLSRMPDSSSTEPIFTVDSFVVTKTHDTVILKSDLGAHSESDVSWYVVLKINRDINMRSIRNQFDRRYNQVGHSIYDGYSDRFIDKLKFDNHKAGDKIKIEHMRSLLIGNTSGENLSVWSLFFTGDYS